MQSSLHVIRLPAGIPERIATRIRVLLASAPDVEAPKRCLERLKQESPTAFERIASSPAALRCAVNIFSYSQFLSETVLRNPERLLQLSSSGNFYRVLSLEEYEERLLDFLGREHAGTPSAMDLARFRRWQLLRIALRDVMGVAALADVTEELSNLADAILDFTYRRIRAELVAQYGEPRLDDGSVCGFSVISLGKLGGKELNYSSDIDLMFVYSGNGETDGPVSISNKEFCKKIANQYTGLLSTYTADGQCYRVDLRLRPDGTLGEICVSGDGARAYYGERARDWEKQMLIKARISAGEPGPATALLEFVEPLIYQSSLDFRAVEAVSETRQRISEKAAARKRVRRGLDIKLTPGGIRDIEFLVQCLQRLHGGREPWVRYGGTMLALFRLRDKRLLSDAEYGRLATAYQFLRYVEHRLQMDEDRQTHTLPPEGEELDLLARKMPPDGTGNARDGESFRQQVDLHLAAVQEIYDRVIHAQKPLYYTPAPVPPLLVEEVEPTPPASNLERLLDQRAPQMAQVVSAAGLHRGRERFDIFLEKAFASPALLDRLDEDTKLAAGVLDLFEHSPYFADELLRHPELLDAIADAIGGAAPGVEQALDDGGALRRFYRYQMMRIQCDSILQAAPIFDTLRQTSALADSVIRAAYRIAVAEGLPPAGADYTPHQQMMVVSLGRLGLSEFDLGSDADLVFVIPDADAGELGFWTGVAERMIQTMGSYTGEGVMFTVDTRLRPDGREGDLVQTEGTYKNYFAEHAAAWEGITYMKARAVAGNVERATDFLHELQEVDWRRYGHGMRSRQDLAEMRARLEREQGPRNPLKAGPGGYYDIDFALMYLRLRGAGIFYKQLNTPERIAVIENAGQLDREDARFLGEAATFYRALDHSQRVSTGHSEGGLHAAHGQLEVLTNLVKRWTPEHLHGRSIDATLRQIRGRTREFFNRLFTQ